MNNSINSGCNISKFYEGMKNIDPHLLKKQTFQQGEIYVFMKSIIIDCYLLNSACETLLKDGSDECDYNKLIIDSNQILTLGYRNLKYNQSINITISSDLTVNFINGSTCIIFNENTIINNGLLSIYHSNFCLESNHQAKFINNNKIVLNNSQLFGTGMIINNNIFEIICYSKVYLGRLKKNKEEKDLVLNEENNTIDSYLYDFGQHITKFINAGTLNISGYSLFDLLGYFINGVSDICNYLVDNCQSKKLIEYNKKTQICSRIFIKSNSRFLFTGGDYYSDSFINDCNGLIISETNTYFRVQSSNNSNNENLSKNSFVNKGNIIFNGEVYFISINIENYKTIKNTINTIKNYIENGIEFTESFNYSKIICVNNRDDFIPSFKNIGNKSLLEISPTCSLHIFGYHLINQGNIGIGISKNNVDDCNCEKGTDIEIVLSDTEELISDNIDNINLLNVIKDIKINGEFIFGFAELNNNFNIMFKNWGNIYVFSKSRFILGYNSSCVINGKRQVILFNYGLIRNWGYLKVCRFSEIINLPSFPFNPDCKLYGIINGSDTCCLVDVKNKSVSPNCKFNSIVIVMRPIPNIQNNPYTGGFIKSENKIFSNCSVIKNFCSGVIISWYGYQEDLANNDCEIVYGIKDENLKKSNSGKLIPLPYPDSLDKWPQKCLSKFIEHQSFSFDFDFKIS